MAKIKIRKKTKVIPHKKSTKVDWQKDARETDPDYSYRPRKFNPSESQVKKYKIGDGKKVYKYKKVKYRTKSGVTDEYYERNPKYLKIK